VGVLAWATYELVTAADADVEAVPTRAALCDEYDVLLAHLDSAAVFSTQAGNRAARKLSVMAQRYVQPAAGDTGGAAAGPSVAQAGEDIVTAMNAVAWETQDLVTATRPVALECGWDWPVTMSPPSAVPRPPTS
jgi:hypothetical protein